MGFGTPGLIKQRLFKGAGQSSAVNGKSSPEFEGAVVRDTLQQISNGKDANETAIMIQDRNSMNPFIQHDAGNFPDLCRGCCRNNSGRHDFSQSPPGGLSLIGRRDQFRNMVEEVTIRYHPDEGVVHRRDGDMVEPFV